VLSQAIIREGLKAVASGRNPMDVKRGIDKAVVEAAARANPNVIRVLEGAEPKKVIVVPDRLVNLVA